MIEQLDEEQFSNWFHPQAHVVYRCPHVYRIPDEAPMIVVHDATWLIQGQDTAGQPWSEQTLAHVSFRETRLNRHFALF